MQRVRDNRRKAFTRSSTLRTTLNVTFQDEVLIWTVGGVFFYLLGWVVFFKTTVLVNLASIRGKRHRIQNLQGTHLLSSEQIQTLYIMKIV